MPHMFVEYSSNLNGLNEDLLLEKLNAAVCANPTVSDEADVKTRIHALNQYRIGLHPANRAFVHVQLNLMAGRTPEIKKQLSDAIAAVLKAHVQAPDTLKVQLSVDICDMDRDSYFKGTL